jgi:putative ABC transport system permease protein
LNSVDPGFEPDGLARALVSLPAARYPNSFSDWPESPQVKRFYADVTERIRALPDVEDVALAPNSPVDPGWTSRVMVEGGPATVEEGLEESRIRPVTYNYFSVAGIPLVRGRSLNEFDTGRTPPVVMVNQSFAGRYFPDANPVGRWVSFWGAQREIVGVVGDVRFMGLGVPSRPAVYAPMTQLPFGSFNILVKSAGDPAAVLPAIAEQVRQIDGALAVDNLQTVESMMDGLMASRRFTVTMFLLFAALALSLAIVGIYGVISYSVSRRVREFGIRLSLGADASALRKLVAFQGLKMGLVGIVAGGVIAIGVTRFMKSILFEVSALDPTVLGGVALLLALTALFSAAVPAFRASNTDPMTAMREE